MELLRSVINLCGDHPTNEKAVAFADSATFFALKLINFQSGGNAASKIEMFTEKEGSYQLLMDIMKRPREERESILGTLAPKLDKFMRIKNDRNQRSSRRSQCRNTPGKR